MNFKQLTHLGATLLLTGIIALGLTGCNKQEEEVVFDGPINDWEDIAIPEGAEREKFVASGPVENHHYVISDMTQAELFDFLEREMETNGWELDAQTSTVRNFTKNDHLVNISSNGKIVDEELRFLIVIEPAGTYDDDDEEDESETEEEES